VCWLYNISFNRCVGGQERRWLAIVGSGAGLGHLGLQMAKAKGIDVIGVDARDEGIELSKKVGCQHVFDVRKGKAAVVKEVRVLTEGFGG
jgi:alcohol dehydrogenase, propanol-preferring